MHDAFKVSYSSGEPVRCLLQVKAQGDFGAKGPIILDFVDGKY